MKTQQTNTTSIMASFATIKSLSDAKQYQSPYQILREFISYIILKDSLYSFSAIEMKNRLSSHFCFSIPEAIIKTALKNLPGATLANGIYNISQDEVCTDSLFGRTKTESDEYESRIIELLSEYISFRTGNNMISVDTLSQELTNFLVEDAPSQSTKYSELIGEFILKNEQNREIQDGLDKIREGSILYIGLSHSIGETGSITKPLTLYLGTEILFSLVGYNGEIFQQFADDFWAQVRTANSGKTPKIHLRYFSEIKKEIDEFFDTASEIVEGKRRRLLDKPAMKAITDGCSTAADVDVKKSDFYHKIRYSFGIAEDSTSNYYSEECFTSNLESFDYDDENDKRKKKETAIKLISNINKLRNACRFHNDIESEHLIVTNTKATLLISKDVSDNIKETEGLGSICNFAVSLDRITSLLWYKLGNGFSKAKFPSSVSAILKARIVLSASIAKNAEREFAKVKKEYADGLIDNDQVAARIITLRNKPVLPEDLQGDDIDEMMDFTPEYLSRYEEQVKNDKKALREKETVIETLKADAERRLTEKDETIVAQANAIKNSSEENALLRNELNKYYQQEEAALRKKNRRRNVLRFIWSIVWKLVVLAGLTALAIYLESKCNSKIPAYISMGVNAVGVIYTLWSALKKDKEKYLKNTEESTSGNNQ
ncbi:MAG TPA: hypothetical protein IAD01_02065 [Candidatus Faeciplasma gallinarum]|uniref:Uncharacterized protein n=1 Tax=Candidatus Faeciplasma gallinarum TaxID=2840799 RepID=A0A9D1EMQ0_9FIRM|nr:hypothetical protein [Candidatus Faeciplasma gallinarum]